MRTIGVVTGSRADYGIYLPLLQISLRMQRWIVAVRHRDTPKPRIRGTVTFIEKDGFSISERIEVMLASDTPEAVAKAMGLGTIGFAQVFAKRRPDRLVVLGDRFETHAAAKL